MYHLCSQMYRGRLKDGSYVAIRCLKMKKSHSTRNFMHHIELISKLRHRHLVSALGHCFECYLDDSSVSRIFLIFEYVPNGTLRSRISGTSWNLLMSIMQSYLPNTYSCCCWFWVLTLMFRRGTDPSISYMGTTYCSGNRGSKRPPVFAYRDRAWCILKQSENNRYSFRSEPCCKN